MTKVPYAERAGYVLPRRQPADEAMPVHVVASLVPPPRQVFCDCQTEGEALEEFVYWAAPLTHI